MVEAIRLHEEGLLPEVNPEDVMATAWSLLYYH
jgi:hypothetical protein